VPNAKTLRRAQSRRHPENGAQSLPTQPRKNLLEKETEKSWVNNEFLNDLLRVNN
jgi:hypothetical protein